MPPIAEQTLRSPGRPLDPAVREAMESRFDADFSRVRVHTGAQAEESAAALRAQAYTVGEDIVFGRGRLAPGTGEGQHLLAHELAHVVQQGRGGAPAPSTENGSPLERAASRAAGQAVSGTEPVAVAGSVAPGVMRQPDDEEASEPSRRAKEKQRTQQRRLERARAGKEASQLSRADAERELRALEDRYRQPGAQQRALKTKEHDLKRFKVLLKRAGGAQVDQNRRQGAFDELQRTPTKTSGKPQTKHVGGGPQLPGQDLRPGKDRYAQPDYSIVRRRQDGTLERVHVNLKSDQIDMRSPAKARATARAYVAQAIRNTRHLATGEKIIISFAHTPTKAVQAEMKREFFKSGSPVEEVRFGTTTHKRENYTPPEMPPAGPKTTPPRAPKRTGRRPATKKATKLPKQAASKTKPTAPKVQPPRAKKRKATTSKVTSPKRTVPKTTTSTATGLKVEPPSPTTAPRLTGAAAAEGTLATKAPPPPRLMKSRQELLTDALDNAMRATEKTGSAVTGQQLNEGAIAGQVSRSAAMLGRASRLTRIGVGVGKVGIGIGRIGGRAANFLKPDLLSIGFALSEHWGAYQREQTNIRLTREFAQYQMTMGNIYLATSESLVFLARAGFHDTQLYRDVSQVYALVHDYGEVLEDPAKRRSFFKELLEQSKANPGFYTVWDGMGYFDLSSFERPYRPVW